VAAEREAGRGVRRRGPPSGRGRGGGGVRGGGGAGRQPRGRGPPLLAPAGTGGEDSLFSPSPSGAASPCMRRRLGGEELGESGGGAGKKGEEEK